jgi:hypothetical protein
MDFAGKEYFEVPAIDFQEKIRTEKNEVIFESE